MARRTRNLVVLLGVLGKDAKTVQAGTSAKTTFTLATHRQYKQNGEWKKKTDWHPCVMWNSEKVAAYLVKGTWVEIQGSLSFSQWEKDGQKHTRTEVLVDDLILLDGGGERQNGAAYSSAAADNEYRSDW